MGPAVPTTAMSDSMEKQLLFSTVLHVSHVWGSRYRTGVFAIRESGVCPGLSQAYRVSGGARLDSPFDCSSLLHRLVQPQLHELASDSHASYGFTSACLTGTRIHTLVTKIEHRQESAHTARALARRASPRSRSGSSPVADVSCRVDVLWLCTWYTRAIACN